MEQAPAQFARYRERLQLLAGDELVLAALDLAPYWRRARHAGRRWTRCYGRFNPDVEAYVTLIYEAAGTPQEIVAVEILEAEPASEYVTGSVVFDVRIGWVRVTPFQYDPALTTLAAALRAAGNATVVRYRPRRRCTLKVEAANVRWYAKVFPNDNGARIHADALSLWEAGRAGRLGFAVAPPGEWDRERRTLWQGAVPGVSAVAALFGRQGAAVAQAMGVAAGSLPGSGIALRDTFDGQAQMRRSIRNARELARRIPALAARTQALLDALTPLHAAADNRPLLPIHGAPHPNQWLLTDTGLGLVDFDRLAFGHPELDVATFLGEIDFEDDLAVPAERLCTAFVAGYRSVAGELDADLMRAYRAHKRLAKALRSARAVRADGDRRAAAHLDRALAALEEAACA